MKEEDWQGARGCKTHCKTDSVKNYPDTEIDSEAQKILTGRDKEWGRKRETKTRNQSKIKTDFNRETN